MRPGGSPGGPERSGGRSNSAAAAEALPRRTRCRRRCSEPGSVGFARPGSFDDGDMPLLTRPSDNDVLSVLWLPLLWSTGAGPLLDRVKLFHRALANCRVLGAVVADAGYCSARCSRCSGPLGVGDRGGGREHTATPELASAQTAASSRHAAPPLTPALCISLSTSSRTACNSSPRSSRPRSKPRCLARSTSCAAPLGRPFPSPRGWRLARRRRSCSARGRPG